MFSLANVCNGQGFIAATNMNLKVNQAASQIRGTLMAHTGRLFSWILGRLLK